MQSCHIVEGLSFDQKQKKNLLPKNSAISSQSLSFSALPLSEIFIFEFQRTGLASTLAINSSSKVQLGSDCPS